MFSFDLNLKLSSPFWIHCYVVVLLILLHFPCGYFNNGFHCLPSSRILSMVQSTKPQWQPVSGPSKLVLNLTMEESILIHGTRWALFLCQRRYFEWDFSFHRAAKARCSDSTKKAAGHLRILMRLSLISLTYLSYHHRLWFRQTPSSTSRHYPQSSTSGSITPHFPKSNYRSLMMRILKDGRPRLNSTSKCTIPAK